MRAGDLLVLDGPDAGRVIPVQGLVELGRDVEGPGRLTDPAVSARHARVLRRGDGHVLIEDLGSRNGTGVNGGRVQGSQLLSVGDIVYLGRSVLRLEPGAEETAEPAPPGGVAAPAGPPAALAGAAAGAVGVFDVPPPPGGAPPAPVGAPGAHGGPGGPPYAGPPPSGGGAPNPYDPGRLRVPNHWAGRAALAVAVVVLLAAAFGGGWVVHSNGNNSPTSAPPPSNGGVRWQGTVYVESNSPTKNGNAVLAYDYGAGGALSPLRITAYPTGGSGSANLTDNGTLDATGHLVVAPTQHLLLAVNQGSDTIAVFHIASDGSLDPVAGSPFPSGGIAPAAIGVNGDLVVVVNKAQDGIRHLADARPDYTTFRLGADGALQPTGFSVPEAPGSSPTQALITPDRHLVFASEESGALRVFVLGANGSLTPGPAITPPGNMFPASIPAANRFAIGLSINPSAQVLYAPLANADSLAVYDYESNGKLSFVRAVHDPTGKEPCWSVLSSDATRLYVDDAASNTTSVWNTANPRNPRLVQVFGLKGNGNPWDLSFDPSGRYLFVVTPRARAANVTPGQGNQLHVEAIGPGGRLSEPHAPVALPVALDTNPFGVAVVADS